MSEDDGYVRVRKAVQTAATIRAVTAMEKLAEHLDQPAWVALWTQKARQNIEIAEKAQQQIAAYLSEKPICNCLSEYCGPR